MAIGRMGVSYAKAVLIVGLLLLIVSPAHAVESFEFTLESFKHPQFVAHDIRFTMAVKDEKLSLSGSVAKIEWIGSDLVARQAKVNCDSFVWNQTQISCAAAQLSFELPPVGSVRIPLSFVYIPTTEQLELKGKAFLDKEQIGFDVRLGLKDLDYAVALNGRHDLARLSKLAARWYPLPRPFAVAGAVSYDLKLNRVGKKNHWVRGTLTLEDVEINEPAGEIGCEKLSMVISPDIESDGTDFQVSGTATIKQGAVIYSFAKDAAYMLDTQAGKLSLRAAAHYQTATQTLDIRDLLIQHDSVYTLSLNGRLENLAHPSLDSVAKAEIEVEQFDIQPFLTAYALPGLDPGNWQISGQLHGRLTHHRRDGTAVALKVNEIEISEKIFDRAHLQGLSGILNWHSHLPVRSSLGWNSLTLNRIQTGKTRFIVATKGSLIDIPKLDLPLTKGGLSLSSIRCVDCLGDDRRASASARMSATPLSVFQSMLGMDSTVIPGELSLVMPAVTYHRGRVELDGQLNMGLFGGQVTISKLVLNDVIGRAPRLQGEIAIDRLDLEALTQTVNFGRITGRLSGYVREMKLVNWTPIAFNASLFSTPGDDTRKRISQKAVDALTEIGGAGGALAQSYLRFFQEFSYANMGLSCRLEGDICQLGGIDQTEAGFYILKGSGLPYLSIMGDRSETSWSELIAKIMVIVSSQSAQKTEVSQ